jgi:hypothetical protein
VRPPLLAGALVVALAAPVGASGAPLTSSADLWATVNVCNTAQHRDAMGIRGSMPGNGRAGIMYMRFQAQFYARADGRWHNVVSGGRSPLMRVGSSRHKVRESGVLFPFKPPPAGSSYVLRGVVVFQWRAIGPVVRRGGKIVRAKTGKPLRRRGRVLAHARKRAQSGHPGTVGADPPGYSRGICEIK